MATTALQVYEAIKPRLGEKESQLLIEHITRQTEISVRDLVTKTEMNAANEKLKAELIKWMFIFWIGQFASIVGVLTAILFAFFRK